MLVKLVIITLYYQFTLTICLYPFSLSLLLVYINKHCQGKFGEKWEQLESGLIFKNRGSTGQVTPMYAKLALHDVEV